MIIRNRTGKVLLQVDDSVWDFRGENLQGANFSELGMGSSFRDEYPQAAKGWEHLLAAITLADANLQGADFTDSVLVWAEMSRINAEDACFVRAVFSGARLERAILRNADMRKADLSLNQGFGIAVLKDADLRGADLCAADLSGADLTGADLRGALYNHLTIFPKGFAPKTAGLVFTGPTLV